ncbi:MAG: hypothetical protein QOK31_1888 [Solirubrobacteraceae bacterium]|jgi:DNA-binding CsgD family transcriptional regulator|nr:hypothetical protein [Solirubrobacteraceae bacterium]
MFDSEGLIVVDDDRRYLAADTNAVTLIGGHAGAVLHARIDDDVPPEHRPALDRIWKEFRLKGELRGRAVIMRRDGGRTAVEVKGTWNFGTGQHLIVCRRADRATAHDPRPTARECEILQLAAEGMTTSEIAGRLVISHSTVKTHFENVYPKLRARDRASAVAEALRRGLIG